VDGYIDARSWILVPPKVLIEEILVVVEKGEDRTSSSQILKDNLVMVKEP